MNIDVDHHVSAVDRTVGTRTLAAGDARVVTISRVYPTTAADLWNACTDAERLPRWFAPVTGDLQLGGRYQVEGNAGGEITECEPPQRFAATWEFGGEVSWIEVTVDAVDAESARFTLEHVAHVDDERWTEFGPGAVGVGWDLSFLGMALHLGSSGTFDPADAEAWSISDGGKQFMSSASDKWYDAAVAAGADPAAARASADRVTAFYTGA